MRRAQARVNLAAIERNCARLCSQLRAGTVLCAVVKADGYGHGAVHSARAALAGGATWLAVVDSREACELRAAGLREVPVLVMGALSPDELDEALAAPADVMTHFATADELKDDGFFAGQLELFRRWVQELRREQPQLLAHAANSAAMLREQAAQFDMVRCGVAIYGMDPFGRDAAARGLEPALELSSYVTEVKLFRAGQSAGYGRQFVADADTHVGIVPIGYGDGWRRGLTNN